MFLTNTNLTRVEISSLEDSEEGGLLDLEALCNEQLKFRLTADDNKEKGEVTCPKGVEAEIPPREDGLEAFFEAGERQFQHDGEAPEPVLSVEKSSEMEIQEKFRVQRDKRDMTVERTLMEKAEEQNEIWSLWSTILDAEEPVCPSSGFSMFFFALVFAGRCRSIGWKL
ncbi:hypothetical protein Droror1_Dr00018218 [Drosera rotundifolia]